MIEGKFTQYVKGASAGSLSLGVNLLTGFLSLLLLNRILGKEAYGSLAFAFALMFIIQGFATAGLDRTLLFRVSELRKRKNALVGGNYAVATLLVVFLLGIVVCAILFLTGAYLNKAYKIDFYWFFVASLTVPFEAVNSVMSAWHQANQKSHVAQIMSTIPNILKIILLFFVFILHPTRFGVASTIVSVSILASFSWLLIIPRNSFLKPMYPTNNEIFYGLKLFITRLLATGLERVDILMIGLLSNQVAVAEYSVAQRLANLVEMGHKSINPVFAPRMRFYIAHNQKSILKKEYRQVRSLTSFFTLLILCIYFLLGKNILIVFGDYVEAWPVLIILSIGFLIRQLYGSCGQYLNMSGNANITLFLTIALLLVVVSLNCLLIPKLGAIGAAFSTLSGFLMINSLMVYFILKLDNFVTLNIGIFISIVLLTVNAICLAFLKFNILVPILLLSGTTIILAFSEWKIFFSALKYLIIKFQFQLYN